jgi:Uma2 family endonuclease
MIAQVENKRYSPEEYLAFEVESAERHEYINGVIAPMTGGTPQHNELAINLAAFLKFALRGKAYRTFATDQRLWVPEHNLFTYSDVMVTPQVLEQKPGRKDTLMNPVWIAEVLSKSTKGYDRDEKFAAYRTIQTFQEYLLVDQYRPHVEQYAKTEAGKWLFSEYNGLEAVVVCSAIPFELALADLYENIEFEPG